MKNILFVLNVLFPFCAYAACDVHGIEQDAPVLCGYATGGGMLYGQVKGFDVYSKTENGKRNAKINENDVFVIGLERDEPEILKLDFCNKDGCQTYSYKITRRKYIEQTVTVPDKYMKYPDDVQKRIDRENAEIVRGRASAGKDTSLEFMQISAPLDLKKYKISGVYGSRRVFNGVPKSPHKGLDLAAATGTPVRASASGRVVIATDMYMSGNTVFISHGHGVTSAYLHMDKINVKSGDYVSAGDIIGTVGSTGRSSGAHLHFGVYWDQIALDPELFITNR